MITQATHWPASKSSETGVGPVPHKVIRIAGLVLYAPVKLLPSRSRGRPAISASPRCALRVCAAGRRASDRVMVFVTGEHMATPPAARSWRARFTGILRTPNALEFFGAAIATIWGLSMLLGGGELWLGSAEFAKLAAFLGGRGWTLGIPFFFGVAGLYAMATRNRRVRAISSVLCAVYWWSLAVYFVTREATSISGTSAYGCTALAEIWVFLRVNYGFDSVATNWLARPGND